MYAGIWLMNKKEEDDDNDDNHEESIISLTFNFGGLRH